MSEGEIWKKETHYWNHSPLSFSFECLSPAMQKHLNREMLPRVFDCQRTDSSIQRHMVEKRLSKLFLALEGTYS